MAMRHDDHTTKYNLHHNVEIHIGMGAKITSLTLSLILLSTYTYYWALVINQVKTWNVFRTFFCSSPQYLVLLLAVMKNLFIKVAYVFMGILLTSILVHDDFYGPTDNDATIW